MKARSIPRGLAKAAKRAFSKSKRASCADQQTSESPNPERKAQHASQPPASPDVMGRNSYQDEQTTSKSKKECILLRAAKKVKHAIENVIDGVVVVIFGALEFLIFLYVIAKEGPF